MPIRLEQVVEGWDLIHKTFLTTPLEADENCSEPKSSYTDCYHQPHIRTKIFHIIGFDRKDELANAKK